MKTLNLINKSISDIPYELINFPDGQPHIRIEKPKEDFHSCLIISRYSNPADFFRIAFATDVLRRYGISELHLNISYLMGARMDRVMNEGEPLGIKVIADGLNQLGFKSVKVFDPHSDVSSAVINLCTPISNIELVRKSIAHYRSAENFDGEITLVSPDAGAMKKTGKTGQTLGIHQIVECSKKRNLKDGKLSGFKVNADTLENQVCFITDDICDGGGTFVGIAGELKKLGAAKIILVVSHGIFSKGLTVENVDQIYTTDSYRTFENLPDHFTVFSINDFWS